MFAAKFISVQLLATFPERVIESAASTNCPFTESALLGVLGAGAALVLGLGGYGLLVRSLPISGGDVATLGIDLRFVLLTLSLGVSVGTLAGLGVAIVTPMRVTLGCGSHGQRVTPRATHLRR